MTAITFLDVFEKTASIILGFLYEWEIFNKLELVSSKVFHRCRQSQQWADFARRYCLPGTHHNVLIAGSPAVQESPLVVVPPVFVETSVVQEGTGKRVSEDIVRRVPLLVIGLGETLQPVPAGGLSPAVLHDIIRCMVPGLHFSGPHHENDDHWFLLSSTGRERIGSWGNTVVREVMENRLTPFDVFPYCRNVCWYECHSKIQLRQVGLWGIFWRMSLRDSRDRARKSTWEFKLSVEGGSHEKLEGCRRLSNHELEGLKPYNWIDFLIGTIYIECPGQPQHSLTLGISLNVSVSVSNTDLSTGRGGHIYDFVHAWPLVMDNDSGKNDLICINPPKGPPLKVDINHGLNRAEVSVTSDPQWRGGRICYRW